VQVTYLLLLSICAGFSFTPLISAEENATDSAKLGFEEWEQNLPEDYGRTTRDWMRVFARRCRAYLEAGQKSSGRSLRLYGRSFRGVKWVPDDGGGHVAFDASVDPLKTHLTPRGFASTLTNMLGPLVRDPHYEPAMLGADKDALRELARQVIALQVKQPHKDWDFGRDHGEVPVRDGWVRKFGRGPGLYYFEATYLTLRFFGDILDGAQKSYYLRPALEGRMGHQMSPRPTEKVVVSGWGARGNTHMEENMWGLDNRTPRAVFLKNRDAPGWEKAWEELHRDFVNACATEHLRYCTEVVEGKSVNEWATGSAWWADFTIANHTMPDVMYSQNAASTACSGAGHFLADGGRIPDTFLYNFDYVARRFLLPMTLWRGRIYSPNEKERTRYGEICPYFQAIRLATYLKLRYRDPRAARLERNCLAFCEWSGRIAPGRAYTANLLAQVEVGPSSEEALEAWLSGNALLWSSNEIAVNRTPHRFAMVGGKGGGIDWAVVPKDGDWLFSYCGRLGKGAFTERKTTFFGSGFAALGRKSKQSDHAIVVLPDERTVVIFSRITPTVPGAEAAPTPNLYQELLSTSLNRYERKLYSAEGCRLLSRTADGRAQFAPLASNWLNLENRIGTIVVRPQTGSTFSHGGHGREVRGEFRIPLNWPNTRGTKQVCTIIVCDQDAAGTERLATAGKPRWLDTQRAHLHAALVPGQDDSDYLVAVNWGGRQSVGPGEELEELLESESGECQLELPQEGLSFARILGRECRIDGRTLTMMVEPQSVGLVQVAHTGEPAPVRPQVRLLAPTLRTVFVGGEAYKLKADASGLHGVAEVRFYVSQGGIFAPERLLATVRKPPYSWKWEFAKADHGRYAEIWARAIAPDGGTRDSSHALVMVKP